VRIVKVVEHIRLKYSCRTCEKEGISTRVKSAPVPPSQIPKGFATPSQSDIPNIVLYDYQSGRAGQCALDYLEGYTWDMKK